MLHDVGFQARPATEPHAAEIAKEWLFTCVYALVNGEMRGLCKAFVANVTSIRFFSGVCPFVDDQMCLLRESFSTNVAGVRTVTREVSH